MATWEEIRDEIAGMLADGKPLEDVIAKLEKRKNEMAKAELLKAMDEMKKPKPMTNEEYLRSCNTEQLAESLLNIMANNEFTLYLLHTEKKSVQDIKCAVVEWLKQPHTTE